MSTLAQRLRLPMSLRTEDSELAYQDAKVDGKLKPLEREQVIYQWEHWKLIANRFPYDVAFSVHHLLIPKRQVAHRLHLNVVERAELDIIINGFVEQQYDVIMDNTSAKRSILSLYHIHLCKYHQNRKDMTL